MATTSFRSRTRRWGTVAGSVLTAVALWSGVGVSTRATPAPVPDPETCQPTCAIDGRMLVVAGNDPTTLGNVQIEIGLNFSPTSDGFNFEFFDGDRDATNWDVPFNDGSAGPKPLAPELVIELYPIGDGGKQATPLVRFGPGYFPLPMTNNGWGGISVPFHVPQALVAATGAHTYSLVIRPVNPAVDRGWNAFKIRSNGAVGLEADQVVAFLGAMNVGDGTGANGDLATIYPNWPSLSPTVYDGTWSFKTRLDPFLQEFVVWDGDMDFGNTACTYTDTDDPDTPAVNPNLFAVGSAAEGIADVNGGCRTGLPSDDQGSAVFQRLPSILPNGIVYQVKAPGSPANPSGQLFVNPNPSGNREWEQFRIQLVADAADIPGGVACPVGGFPADATYPIASDCRTTDLPGGVWEIQLDGMDLSNLNFWYFSFKSEPITDEYSIGRSVWYDDDKDGVECITAVGPPVVRCANEPGIANVLVSVSLNGVPVTGGVTDANGEFLFTPLGAGDYTVEVDPSNFNPGGPLEGLTSTTGGEIETGIEVGLPICIDTNNPVGCGQPLYAEAIFGYAQETAFAVLLIDEDTIDENMASVQAISNGPPYCGGPAGGPGAPNVCVNDDLAGPGVRTPLFSRPRDVTPVSGLVLPTGRVDDEGLFKFTLPDPQMSDQNGAMFTISEFFFATGAVANENNLDKIKGVRPLNEADVYALEGHAVCAVVYDSDINWDSKKDHSNLKGGTLGTTAFFVTDVTPNPAGGTYLPLIHLDLLPIGTFGNLCDVSGG